MMYLGNLLGKEPFPVCRVWPVKLPKGTDFVVDAPASVKSTFSQMGGDPGLAVAHSPRLVFASPAPQPSMKLDVTGFSENKALRDFASGEFSISISASCSAASAA